MGNGMDLSDVILTDEDFQELQRAWELKLLRLQYPHVLDLVRVLAKYPRAPRGYVLDMLERSRREKGLPIPRKFEASAQRALEYYCRDSDVFKKRKVGESEALFCWPEGKGAGVWALLRENAQTWVRKNREALRQRLSSGHI